MNKNLSFPSEDRFITVINLKDALAKILTLL
jgi:hypothetical protein